ncbi:MAG: HD domain-containing protein [Okeania sp. SIO2D1]|nr:HD domain-containing protein [Okeania sp. SIO2D1]
MRQQVLTWLANNVPASRVRHILGVEDMAIQLAHHYQVDEVKAGMAGLMHDLAKYFQPTQLLAMAQTEGLTIDPICQANPHLLHADVSAIVARDEFAVQDEEVLTAIRNHTLGSPQMSVLSCIIFVADALEPNRGNNSQLKKMRQVSRENLYESVRQTSDYSLQYLLKRRCPIHPRTVLTRNWALQKGQKTC